MRLLETDSLSNQSIVTALAVGAYTADAARMIYCRLAADQIAGNGNYTAYITIQRGGAGSSYRVVPITEAAVASGVTAAMLTTVGIPVSSGDVVTAYLLGLAGDTTTVDTACEWWEDDSLRPTTADRTLDVAATGECEADVVKVSGDSTAADNLELYCDGGDRMPVDVEEIGAGIIAKAAINADLKTGDYINAQVKGRDNLDFGALEKASLNAATPASVTGAVGSVAGAVGSVTNPVTVGTNNDKTGYALSGAGVTAVQSGLATSANQTTILARLGAWTTGGVNDILGAFKALLSKVASAPSDIGGTFDPASDSVEAIRDTAPLGTAMRGTDGALTAGGYTAPDNATIAAIAAYVDELESRLTAARALLLDNLSDLDAPVSGATAPTAVQVRQEIDANSTQLTALVTRLTEARAGYLNNLSAGAVALEATLTAIKGAGWATETLKAIDTLLDAIKAKTDTIGSVSVTVASVVSDGGDVTTYQGVDYSATDSRSIDWTGTNWPTLTGATIYVYAGNQRFTGSVVTGMGDSKQVRLELTGAQTTDIPAGKFDYLVTAILSGTSREVYLTSGAWYSKRKPV